MEQTSRTRPQQERNDRARRRAFSSEPWAETNASARLRPVLKEQGRSARNGSQCDGTKGFNWLGDVGIFDLRSGIVVAAEQKLRSGAHFFAFTTL